MLETADGSSDGVIATDVLPPVEVLRWDDWKKKDGVSLKAVALATIRATSLLTTYQLSTWPGSADSLGTERKLPILP